jgi:sn-glycerol 3-phosphate transport system ATP-binding protein
MIYVTHDQVEAMTLAQRVMVMNKGVVEQVGTPVEVYERPASQFVASFIGAPAMNLLPGQISSDGTRFTLDALNSLLLGESRAKWANRLLTLGIRPEHIKLSSRDAGGIPLVVETLEMLGADNLAHGRIGNARMVVRLPHSERPLAGSTLWLHLPSDALHFFDSTYGKRLE